MFGLCIECEEPIPAKRLELMPYVELCVECQQATDGAAPRAAAGTCATSADRPPRYALVKSAPRRCTRS